MGPSKRFGNIAAEAMIVENDDTAVGELFRADTISFRCSEASFFNSDVDFMSDVEFLSTGSLTISCAPEYTSQDAASSLAANTVFVGTDGVLSIRLSP